MLRRIKFLDCSEIMHFLIYIFNENLILHIIISKKSIFSIFKIHSRAPAGTRVSRVPKSLLISNKNLSSLKKIHSK